MSSILRLEDDNELTLIGYDLGNFDPLAITCAPSGTVYFTNGEGIYRILISVWHHKKMAKNHLLCLHQYPGECDTWPKATWCLNRYV